MNGKAPVKQPEGTKIRIVPEPTLKRLPLYQAIAKIVKDDSGISYDDKTYYQLDARIDNLKKFMGLETDAELFAVVAGKLTSNQRMMVIDLATNNETYFYRDQNLFTNLEKVIFPQLVTEKKKPN